MMTLVVEHIALVSIKFKTSMLKSSLCVYNIVYILAKQTIAITGRGTKDNLLMKSQSSNN